MVYYFDHAASAVPFQEVTDLLCSKIGDNYFNPGASHSKGRAFHERILLAKQNFLKLLNLNHGDFLFPPSATLANNLVVLGFNHQKDSEVFCFSGDHPSLVLPVKHLKNKGVVVKEIPLKKYYGYDDEALLEEVSEKTTWLYLTSVNNQSGLNNPVEKLALSARLKFPNIKIHLDASQSFGKISYDYSLFDSVTLSSHKCGGPKNIAGLWLKDYQLYSPLYFGGAQQLGLFSQTEDALLIEAFSLAASLGIKSAEKNYQRIKEMQDELIEFLKDLKIPVLVPFKNISPYITMMIIPDFPSDVVLRIMEEKNCILSSTAACSSKIKGFNSVFASLGIDESHHKHVIRLSFGVNSSKEDLNFFKDKFSEFIAENSFLIKMKKR